MRTFGMPPQEKSPVDLAANRPGQAVRLRADLEWQKSHAEKPVRSVLRRVTNAHTDERAWRIGADGEELVAVQLARVARKDSRWRFLHAIPVGRRGSDIDHLAIGPGGVFTLNAKHHVGARVWAAGTTFMINGRRQPYIRNSLYESERASRLLSVALGAELPVWGVIVPVNCRDVRVKALAPGVSVIPRMQLFRWMRRMPQVLTVEQIETIFEAARRPTSWRH